ncbi:MAG: S41 family peptidase [Cellulophaga sp.]
MRKLLFYLLPLLLITSCASIEKHNHQITKLHSVDELHKDVDLAYRKLQKLHPQLYLYTPKKELDAKFTTLKSSITKPMTTYAFYEKLAPVVAEVRQGHAGISVPTKKYTRKENKAFNKLKNEWSYLRFENVEDAVLVKNTLGEDSTMVGSRVVKLGDDSVDDLLKRYKTYFSSDGYNTTFHNKYAAQKLARYYYQDKGRLDSLEVTFSKNDSLYTKVFRRIPRDSTRFPKQKKDSLKDKKPIKKTKEERKLASKKLKKKLEDYRKYGYSYSEKNNNRNLDFIGEDSTVAYMKIRSFSRGDYEAFYEEAFKKIDSAKTKDLIIDLRDNGGGRLVEIHDLFSYLAKEEFKFVEEGEVNTRYPIIKSYMSRNKTAYGAAYKSLFVPFVFFKEVFKARKKNGKLVYKFKETKVAEPKENNYKGNVYVLINGRSFSASSVFSNVVKARKRGVIVGEETGGAYNSTVAGQTKLVRLPNSKLMLYFGLMVLETPYKTKVEGYGVKPDVTITPTLEDRKNNCDPELEWILDAINK